jgi:hypothetical protein
MKVMNYSARQQAKIVAEYEKMPIIYQEPNLPVKLTKRALYERDAANVINFFNSLDYFAGSHRIVDVNDIGTLVQLAAHGFFVVDRYDSSIPKIPGNWDQNSNIVFIAENSLAQKMTRALNKRKNMIADAIVVGEYNPQIDSFESEGGAGDILYTRAGLDELMGAVPLNPTLPYSAVYVFDPVEKRSVGHPSGILAEIMAIVQ